MKETEMKLNPRAVGMRSKGSLPTCPGSPRASCPDGWHDCGGSSLPGALSVGRICEQEPVLIHLTCVFCLHVAFAAFSQTVSETRGSICFPIRECSFITLK